MRWSWRTARAAALTALACAALVATPASAQDAKARAEARKLEKEAAALFDKGDWAAALEKYERMAELVSPSLSTQLKAARCLEKLGRLIEASERFEAIAKTTTASSRADNEAQEAARKARKELEERIPTVTIDLVGVDALSKVTLTLDGKPFPRTKVGVKLPVDPGDHVLEGTLERVGEDPIASRQPFFVNEREHVPVPFRFVREPPKSATATAPSQEGNGGATPSEDYWAMLKHDGGAQRTIGWVVVGLGGAAVLGGVVTTFVALGVKDGLDDQCPDNKCPPEAFGDLDTYEALKTTTTILYVSGALGMAVGVALLATSPRDRSLGALVGPRRAKVETGPRVSPWVGLGSAGVVGRF